MSAGEMERKKARGKAKSSWVLSFPANQKAAQRGMRKMACSLKEKARASRTREGTGLSSRAKGKEGDEPDRAVGGAGPCQTKAAPGQKDIKENGEELNAV